LQDAVPIIDLSFFARKRHLVFKVLLIDDQNLEVKWDAALQYETEYLDDQPNSDNTYRGIFHSRSAL